MQSLSMNLYMTLYKSRRTVLQKSLNHTGILLLSTFLIIYFLLLENCISFDKIWPIMGLFPSIALIVYYMISSSKSPATIIPGIFIAIISLVLFLNTADIISINLKKSYKMYNF